MLDTALTPRRVKRLNPRQRKKLHVGEFREFAFKVWYALKVPLEEASGDAFIDALFEAVEDRGLMAAGFGSTCSVDEVDGYVCAMDRGSPSDEDRQWLVDWLQARPEVQSARADDFIDAWYATGD